MDLDLDLLTKDGMIAALCVHAFMNEYADNPVGNLALRILRTQLLEFSSSSIKDPGEFLREKYKDLLPTLVKITKESVPEPLIRYWYYRLDNAHVNHGLELCEKLEQKYKEHQLDGVIAEEFKKLSEDKRLN